VEEAWLLSHLLAIVRRLQIFRLENIASELCVLSALVILRHNILIRLSVARFIHLRFNLNNFLPTVM